MKVECSYKKMVDVATLVPHPRNPNKHNPKQIKLLAKIMTYQGWRNPIVVSNQSGFIVAGHGRLEAAKVNGWTEVPVDYQDFKSEAAEYSHMVADNKIAELANVDMTMVMDDLSTIQMDDLDYLGIPGFTIAKKGLTEDDEVPDNAPTVCQKGDLWRLGGQVQCPSCKKMMKV